MVTKDDFIKCINAHNSCEEFIDKLCELGFDITNTPIFEYLGILQDTSLKSNFTDEGVDFINWWLYERIDPISKQVYKVYDDNNNEIKVDTPEELWSYVTKKYLLRKRKRL